MNLLFFVLGVFWMDLALSHGIKHSFLLHPTNQIVNERRRALNDKNTSGVVPYPEAWLLPRSNAVYATLPKEGLEPSTPDLQDFHGHRHLSRWERKLRIDMEQDLQTNWNGSYLFEEDGSELRSRTLGGKSVEMMIKGGRYNHFAAAPLNQGYGTHYANIWVGSPRAQRKTVIVDTGSHYTAFPCKGCDSCGEEHHTDPYFDPDLSQTFRSLQCNECTLGASCKGHRCIFSQSYTEGSSWEAYQVEDKLYLAGRDVLASADPRNTDYAIDFMFGCQTSETGLFVTQLADGIMGMSAHEMTLTKQLFDKKKVEHNMFALCFRRELGTSKNGVTAGVMTLGGIDNRLDSSPMLFAKNIATTGWFTVYVKNIFIRAGGGQSATSKTEPWQHVLKIPLDLTAVNSGKGVIVDSGTTDTYLHKKLAKSFASVWKTVTKKEYSHNGFLLTDDQLRRLPTILVQMKAYSNKVDPSIGSPDDVIGYTGSLDPTSPYDVMIAIPATNYMEYSPTTGLFTSRLYFTETQGGVLGANAMQGHNIVFDWENGRVGFAESSCAYQDEHAADQVDNMEEINRFGNDCVLGSPVMTQSCVESANSNFCSEDPSRILMGSEVWTRVIENTGTGTGMSCKDVMLMETPYKGHEPPVTECADGLCSEHRPCEIPCSELERAQTTVRQVPEMPCLSGWSVCDTSCIQSHVSSSRKPDGICYEESRISRECHTGACGRNDPCRVPYLVHTVLGFRGANKDLWTAEYLEKLPDALISSIRQIKNLDESVISVGDVAILMTSPWYENFDETNMSPEMEVGLKIVLQISFYNFNAKMIEDSVAEEADTSETTRGSPPQRLLKLQEDIKNLFSKARGRSTCVESDLYPLANSALAVHDALKRDNFMLLLFGEMKKAEGENTELSPFMKLYNQEEFMRGSRVLSSWTIRTEVEEDGFLKSGTIANSALNALPIGSRTLWLGLTAIVLFALWGVDKIWNCGEKGDARSSYEPELTKPLKNKLFMEPLREDPEEEEGEESDEVLFNQLFRPRHDVPRRSSDKYVNENGPTRTHLSPVLRTSTSLPRGQPVLGVWRGVKNERSVDIELAERKVF